MLMNNSRMTQKAHDKAFIALSVTEQYIFSLGFDQMIQITKVLDSKFEAFKSLYLGSDTPKALIFDFRDGIFVLVNESGQMSFVDLEGRINYLIYIWGPVISEGSKKIIKNLQIISLD